MKTDFNLDDIQREKYAIKIIALYLKNERDNPDKNEF
jgi:hypothetical protein